MFCTVVGSSQHLGFHPNFTTSAFTQCGDFGRRRAATRLRLHTMMAMARCWRGQHALFSRQQSRFSSRGQQLRFSSRATSALRCVMLNAARLDYDGRISLANISKVAKVTRFEASTPSEILARVADHEIIINKGAPAFDSQTSEFLPSALTCCFALLTQPWDETPIAEAPMPGELIRSFPSAVKLICEAGTGYNNIDIAACRDKGIALCNVPTYAAEAMAHMAVTFIMVISCSLWPQAKALATTNRAYMQQCHLGALPHFELTGKTVGLIGGLGTIGLRVAAMSQALGMKVVASSRATPVGLRADGIEVVAFDELLARSDFVSVHCPLNAHTKGLVDAAALSKMKPSAYVINTCGRASSRSHRPTTALCGDRPCAKPMSTLSPSYIFHTQAHASQCLEHTLACRLCLQCAWAHH